MNVVGIMSGTSLDGVDFVLCKEKPNHELKYIDKHFVPFNKKLKDSLLKAVANELDLWSSAQLHYDLGEFYALSLKKIIKLKPWKFQLIGLHGQTVYHSPQKSTLQIGEPSFLSKEFNVPVISQFRNMNIAYGGQGAPLAPFFHKALMSKTNRPWAFQNLGGMGNVTYKMKNKLYAFDTGPGNILINEYMGQLFNKELDKDGRVASQGLPHLELVHKWIKSIDYFSKPTPKTCGRENFSVKALAGHLKPLKGLSAEDQIATLTEFTVLSLKDQYQRFIKPFPELIIVAGGGAKNKRLMQRMRFHFKDCEILDSETFLSWPADAIEGGAFAWLALKRFRGEKILDLPTVTGSSKATQLGVIC